MSNENPFETRFEEYDAWFERFPNVFESELNSIATSAAPSTCRILGAAYPS